LRRIVDAYPELLLVLVAAAIGLIIGRPLRWVGGHQGINVLLAILVFATAITVSTEALGRLKASWPQLAAALVIGAVVLPVLSWLASRVVAAGSLRNGVMTSVSRLARSLRWRPPGWPAGRRRWPPPC
jgi:predicted Na+-dependent transporter